MFSILKRKSFPLFRSCHSTPRIKQILGLKDEEPGRFVNVKGWVRSLRDMKETIFIDLTDGSSSEKLQVVIPKTIKPSNLTTGSSVSIQGSLEKSPRGTLEIKADNISVLGECVVSDGYPFVPRQKYSPDYVRQFLHLRPRTNKFSSLLRVRDAAIRAINNFYEKEGYIMIHTPILTSNDCEGAGEIFSVQPENKKLLKDMARPNQVHEEIYFDSKVFLTVSGQLHLEAAVHGISKVYTLGPTFRAENSKSRLHLSEFYMLEAEEAFLYDLESLTDKVEKMVQTVTKEVLDKHIVDVGNMASSDFATKNSGNFDWISKKFPVLTYSEAVDILESNQERYKGGVKRGAPLTKEHEHFLVFYNNSTPTFIVDWPIELKPFYMKALPGDSEKVAAFDLLVPNVGELVGGSLREDDYEKLKSKLPKDFKHLQWYLDLRKFGGVPSGGYGMGFERYLQLIMNVKNIKDTIPFPRWPHNCSM